MPTNKMSISSPAPFAKYCPGLNDLCAKKYEFGPFWGESVLRKQARDELCSICDTFRFVDPQKNRVKIDIIFYQRGIYISQNDYDNLIYDIYEAQKEIRNTFLARVRDDIERYKNTNQPTITVAGIRRMYENAQNRMDELISQFTLNYVKFIKNRS